MFFLMMHLKCNKMTFEIAVKKHTCGRGDVAAVILKAASYSLENLFQLFFQFDLESHRS